LCLSGGILKFLQIAIPPGRLGGLSNGSKTTGNTQDFACSPRSGDKAAKNGHILW